MNPAWFEIKFQQQSHCKIKIQGKINAVVRSPTPRIQSEQEQMQSISEYFYRKSTVWTTLTTLALFVLFLWLILPAESERSAEVIGTSVSPDTSFYYTKSELYQIAENYGERGRLFYIDTRITFDIIWPFIYTIFLITGISWITDKIVLEGSKVRLLNLVPIGAILFDFLENISNMVIMFRYPTPTDILASLAGVFTALKWVFVGGSFVIFALAILLWIAVKVNLVKT